MYNFIQRLRWRIVAPVLFLLGGLLFWFLGWRSYAALHAVPVQTALVLTFSSPDQLKTLAPRDGGGISTLRLMEVLRSDIALALALLPSSGADRPDFCLAAAFSLNPNDSLHPLVVVDLGYRPDPVRLLEHAGKSSKVSTSVFRGTTLISVEMPGGRITVAAVRNLVFFSRHSYLVEDALAQVPKREPWWQRQAEMLDAPLRVVLRPVVLAERCKGRMMPEWEHLPGLFAAKSTSTVLGFDGKRWQIAVRAMQTNNGGGDEQMPRANMATILPDNTAVLAWAGTGRTGALGAFVSDGGNDPDFRHFVQPWAGKEAAWVLVEPYSAGMRDDLFWVFAVRDEPLAKKLLNEYGDRSGLLRRYEYQTFEIHQFLSGSLLEPLANKGRNNFKNPACVLLDGYAVFAASASALELWIDKYVVSQTLANQGGYLLLDKQTPALSTNYLYVNTAYVSMLAKHLFDPALGSAMQSDIAALQNMGLIGLDLHNNSTGMWSGHLAGQASTASKPEASILWKTPIGGQAITQPFLVPATEPNKEATILIQDDQHDLYCLTVGGNLLWRKQLDMPIQSAVRGIDFFGNGGICYLFNTAKAVWVLNEEGQEVVGYPLRLLSPATNGVTAVDFSDEHRFGLFVACENGNLYGFDQYGRPLRGWNPMSGVGRIPHPLIHYKGETKDYLAVLSLDGQLSVFNRIGIPQLASVHFKGDFFGSPPQFDIYPEVQRIVCPNASGQIFTYSLGGQIAQVDLALGKNKHIIVSGAILSGAGLDLAVLSGNTLSMVESTDNSFKKKAELVFPTPQDTVFLCGQKGMVGTLNRSKRQVFLVHGTGKMFPGFPLAGTTPFVLYHLPADTKNNILVVGNGASVYAYKVPRNPSE